MTPGNQNQGKMMVLKTAFSEAEFPNPHSFIDIFKHHFSNCSIKHTYNFITIILPDRNNRSRKILSI